MATPPPTKIRPATLQDIKDITRLTRVVSRSNPVINLIFPDLDTFIKTQTAKYSHHLSQPDYFGSIAYVSVEGEEKVVGFCLWRRPEKETEDFKGGWKMEVLEGMNKGLIEEQEKLFGEMRGKFGAEVGKFWELNTLIVQPSYQRQGIATSLIQNMLKEVEKAGGGKVFVKSSAVAKQLYEKLGWNVLGESKQEFEEKGRDAKGEVDLKHEVVSYWMLREDMLEK